MSQAWKVSLGGTDSVDVLTAMDAVRLGQYIGALTLELQRHQQISATVYEECGKNFFLGGHYEISSRTVDALAVVYTDIPHHLRGKGV